MNKSGQAGAYGIISGVLALVVLAIFANSFVDIWKANSCTQEKSDIKSLQDALGQCRTDLASQATNYQNLLSDCYSKLDKSETDKKICQDDLTELQKKYDEAVKPIIYYSFITVYNDKTLFFDNFVIYHIQSLLLFFGFGITITLKLFDITLEVHTFNKKEQRKIRNIIRNYLATKPWGPVFWIVISILAVNLLLWLSIIL